MQKHNHIKALFFLGIFSMLLLHQVVPHLHHQHEDSHSHKTVAHSEDRQHHHDTPEKDDNSKNGLIDLFLDMHVHTAVSDEIPVIRELIKKQKVVDKVDSDVHSLYRKIVLKDYCEVEKPSIYHPPNNYFNLYTANLNLRGPPSLG